jgi:DNA-binding NtrC family response regulator
MRPASNPISPAAAQTHEFLGVAAIIASDSMQRILRLASRVAPSNAAVLVTGESGSGKEVIARAIHHHSQRSAKSWIDINCAALPENLLESELFGHEKGAFSGADSTKPGLFELADGGTLFLDEIGDLDLRMQVKLLRILDGAPYYRLGGVKKVTVDVRIITATNQDLRAAVSQGRFRSDLYHRLSQITIAVPPLRERADDILPLARHFLDSQNPELRLTAEAAERLKAHAWPGNVRELRNVVVRAAVLALETEITAADLPDEFSREAFSSELRNFSTFGSNYSNSGGAILSDLERNAIAKALEDSRGHQQKAADQLGISKRTLQRKIKSYGLTAERSVSIAR